MIKLTIKTPQPQSAFACSKLTIYAPEVRHWRRPAVFIVNFEHISHLDLVFLLLTLTRQMPTGSVFEIKSNKIARRFLRILLRFLFFNKLYFYNSFTSGECLQMSLNADAEILFSGSSGSCIHNTSNGTAPASTTAWDNSSNERSLTHYSPVLLF